jgi:hypothetical protein
VGLQWEGGSNAHLPERRTVRKLLSHLSSAAAYMLRSENAADYDCRKLCNLRQCQATQMPVHGAEDNLQPEADDRRSITLKVGCVTVVRRRESQTLSQAEDCSCDSVSILLARDVSQSTVA